MPYRNRTRALATAALAVGAFFVALMLGWFRPITDPFTRAVTAAAAPLYRVGNLFASISSAAKGDTASSPDELEALKIENARLRELVAENQALKDALGYKERRQISTSLTARVVSQTTSDVFHGLIIDRGSDDGLREGQPVVTGDGVIIGKVSTLTPRAASVMLLTDSRSRLAVSLQNKEQTIGVLEGDRGISLSVGLIPQGETVSPGDTVVTSGLEPGIRRGLVVGTVDKVTREAADPFQTASIVAMDAADRPSFVEVLLIPELE